MRRLNRGSCPPINSASIFSKPICRAICTHSVTSSLAKPRPRIGGELELSPVRCVVSSRRAAGARCQPRLSVRVDREERKIASESIFWHQSLIRASSVTRCLMTSALVQERLERNGEAAPHRFPRAAVPNQFKPALRRISRRKLSTTVSSMIALSVNWIRMRAHSHSGKAKAAPLRVKHRRGRGVLRLRERLRLGPEEEATLAL